MFRKGLILGIDKVDAPEENEESFSSACKFSCALDSARAENLSGMKIPFRPGRRAFGNFLLGDVHAVACGLKIKGLRPLHTTRVFINRFVNRLKTDPLSRVFFCTFLEVSVFRC